MSNGLACPSENLMDQNEAGVYFDWVSRERENRTKLEAHSADPFVAFVSYCGMT